MINLEIEIVSEDAKEQVYELRNYLAERMENLQIAVKEQPALEGEMSVFSAEGILNGVIHAGMGIGIEHCIHVLWPLISEWLKKVNLPKGKKIEVLATLGDDSGKVTVSEDNEGVVKRYDDVSYSIDTSHTRVLLIGCGEFENDFPPILPVKGNLEDLYRLFTDKRNIGLPPENITVAMNKSNAEIEELLLRISKIPDTETLLIYFSGHGYRSDINKLYLIARNTRKIEDYILNGIDYDFIRNGILKTSAAKQKIIILDACHSGIATQGKEDAILDLQVTGSYVLASSESDEVSYFDKNKRNTFFTGILLDTLRKGIDNAKEMLSLDDLYVAARAQLDQKQQPRFKDKLTISPADFFIARNPSFSLEKIMQQAKKLFKEGRLAEAYRESNKVLKRFPDNADMKELAGRCNTELLINQLVKEGDELFYQRHHYQKALDSYEQAYEIRPDFALAEKIKNCRDHLSEKKKPGVDLDFGNKEAIDTHTKKIVHTEKEEKKKKKEIPKQLFAILIAIGVVALGSLLMLFFKEGKEKYTIRELTSMLYADPATALTNLRKSKKKDSANYVLGNYYREDRSYDSAAWYYHKAIAASDLPAAYSALADMYSKDELKDSSDNRMVYTLLLRADSLFKADTTVYYQLGNLSKSRAIIAAITLAPNRDSLFNQTIKWYTKGYKKGSTQCAEALAMIYLKKSDPAAAFPFLKEAAEKNSTTAQIYLSDILAHGSGVPANQQESEKWYRLYIKNAKANELSQMAHTYYTASEIADYTEGYSVGRDCKKAAELFLAAESKIGSVTDQYERGTIYEQIARFFDNGIYCAKRDHEKAIAYFKMAAASGNVWVEMELNELQREKKK